MDEKRFQLEFESSQTNIVFLFNKNIEDSLKEKDIDSVIKNICAFNMYLECNKNFFSMGENKK